MATVGAEVALRQLYGFVRNGCRPDGDR